MKKMTVKLENLKSFTQEVKEVKNECAMWKTLREVRDKLTDEDLKAGAKAIVTLEDGSPFKDITFRRNKKGKIEMPNAVKETNRIRTTNKNGDPVKAKRNKKMVDTMEDVKLDKDEMANVLAEAEQMSTQE